MKHKLNDIQNNEIDLRELFMIFKKRIKLIFSLTVFMTLFAIVYALFIAKPVYYGDTMIEVGQIINKQHINGQYTTLDISTLDNIINLKTLINKTTNVSVEIPKGSNNLLILSFKNPNKTVIKKELEKAISNVFVRHKELENFYSEQNVNVKMTQIISDIDINKKAIEPKKKLIVMLAFMTSLILSIFLVYFLEAIKTSKVRNLKSE